MKGCVRDLLISFFGSLLTVPIALLLPADAVNQMQDRIESFIPFALASPKTGLAVELYISAVVVMFLILSAVRWNTNYMNHRKQRLYGSLFFLPNPWSNAEWRMIDGIFYDNVVFPIEQENTLRISRDSFRIGQPICSLCGSTLQGSAGRWRFFYRCNQPTCNARVVSTISPLREAKDGLEDQLRNLGLNAFLQANEKHLVSYLQKNKK